MSAPRASTPGNYEPEERDRLIVEHLPQVRWIAARLQEKIQGRVELDDLISAGAMGLIAAIDRFDPARNLQLKTYAEHKIRGAILDYLRSCDSLSRDNAAALQGDGTARAGWSNACGARHACGDRRRNGLNPRTMPKPSQRRALKSPFAGRGSQSSTDGKLKFSEVMPDSSALSPEQKLAESELRSFVSAAIRWARAQNEGCPDTPLRARADHAEDRADFRDERMAGTGNPAQGHWRTSREAGSICHRSPEGPRAIRPAGRLRR